ncbi:hypothetical protein DKX38_019268 [Salix brachista]|uniref:Uncharacterized protein n=1 Tax=Salix brachista TaxID=2182728 RepID=A0A5N5KFT2_9ROSI|nr:hypothetical protein DKX38_019268 [Salix brachista]
MALTHNFNHIFPIFSSSSKHKHALTTTLPFSLKTHTNFFSTNISSRIHNLQSPLPTFTRRLFLPSVSGIWDALTGGNNNPREAVMAIRRGMLLFRQGDVLGSLVEFDKAIELDTRQKACKFLGILIVCFLRVVENVDLMRIMMKLCGGCDLDLWQRGLSLYYVDRY